MKVFMFLIFCNKNKNNRTYILSRGGGGGVLPYPYHREGFLRRCGLKTGIRFAYFGLESRTVFEGTTGLYEGLYRFNSK